MLLTNVDFGGDYLIPVCRNEISTRPDGTDRSSCLEVFCGKDVLRDFTKFTRKHLCHSVFFNKVAGLRHRPATLLKRRLWHRRFPVNFAQFVKNTFFIEHLGWLLLDRFHPTVTWGKLNFIPVRRDSFLPCICIHFLLMFLCNMSVYENP